MTREETLHCMKANSVLHSEICEECPLYGDTGVDHCFEDALDEAIKALEQEPIDKAAMMYEIYMEGVNMAGEYQGCWVRFKDIEKIVDKYIKGGD